jgi:hypothetical protein
MRQVRSWHQNFNTKVTKQHESDITSQRHAATKDITKPDGSIQSIEHLCIAANTYECHISLIASANGPKYYNRHALLNPKP